MSEKTYTADFVAIKVLEKYRDLEKGLFAEQKMCSPVKSEDSKESVFYEIKWCLDEIKRLKELSWTVEQEAPSAKDLFEKEFEKQKDKLATLVRRHKALKKNEDAEDEDFMAKAEEVWKAEKTIEVKEGVVTPSDKKDKKDQKQVDKCGETKVMKADDSKLKAFLASKKAKKAGKMEKMLGMNQGGTQQASTGIDAPKPSIATQIGWPGTKK